MFNVILISGKRLGMPVQYECFPFFDDEYTVEDALAQFKYVEMPGITETIDGSANPVMAYEYLGNYFSKVTYAGTVSFEDYLAELFDMNEEGLNLTLE